MKTAGERVAKRTRKDTATNIMIRDYDMRG